MLDDAVGQAGDWGGGQNLVYGLELRVEGNKSSWFRVWGLGESPSKQNRSVIKAFVPNFMRFS